MPPTVVDAALAELVSAGLAVESGPRRLTFAVLTKLPTENVTGPTKLAGPVHFCGAY